MDTVRLDATCDPVKRLAALIAKDKKLVRAGLPLAPPSGREGEQWIDWLTAGRAPVVELYGRRLPQIVPGVDLDTRLVDAVGSTTQHPRRLPALALEAAYAKHISGWCYVCVGSEYRLDVSRLVDPPPAHVDDPPEVHARHVRRLIRDGGRYWAMLGAWPWAAFEDGRLSTRWRTSPQALDSFADWLEAIHRQDGRD